MFGYFSLNNSTRYDSSINFLAFRTRTQPSAVLLLVLDSNRSFEYEYHFIKYEYERWQKNDGVPREVSKIVEFADKASLR